MSDANELSAANGPQKLPPQTAQVRNQAQPRRLRKNVIVGIIAVLSGVLLLALVFGITKNPIAPNEGEVLMPAIADQNNVPGFVKTGPQTYADIPEPEPVIQLGPAMQGDLAAAGLPAPNDSPFEHIGTREETEEEKQLAQEWYDVLAAPIELNIKLDLGTLQQTNTKPQATAQQLDPTTAMLAGLRGSIPGADDGADTRTGSQARKIAFLEDSPSSKDGFYVGSRLQVPHSPYEVKTGAVIPCTLITGINSDLPGSITCHVRQNVFDSVTGNYLLIPQGTRVIGEYDSQVVFGQSRVLVIWHRLVLPNGNSLDLEGMQGVDMSGFSGYSDRVNNHWGQLAGAVVLSSVFAAAPVVAAGDDTGFNRDIESEVARSIGRNTKDAGDRIVERGLAVQPTITIRPGLAINIFVKKDLILAPYTVQTTNEISIDPPTNSN